MLKKLRYKFTFICAALTTIILLCTVVIIFLINKTQLEERHKTNLDTQFSTLAYYLQSTYSNTSQTPSISHLWLNQLEISNNLIIYLEDNHIPLLYEGSYITGPKRHILIDRAKTLAQETYHFNFYNYTTVSQTLKSTTFELKESSDEHYLVSVASLSVHGNNFQIVLLQDMKELTHELHQQLLAYVIFTLIGIITLSLFSFWFTGHTILPIEESMRKQKEFVAAASHELRSPLAVVQTSSSALATQYPNLKSSAFFNAITNECTRMTKLVSDLLLLSHADTERQWSLNLQSTPPDTLLLESYDAFYLCAQKLEHTLTIHLPNEPFQPCLLDASRLSQVIAILIDNALSYTPKGSTITLHLSYQYQDLCIQVIDDGAGISDEHKPLVFERFYRIDTSRHQTNHSGLGLSIAQEIITLHGGKMTLTDTKPHGCTFTLLIPIKYPV